MPDDALRQDSLEDARLVMRSGDSAARLRLRNRSSIRGERARTARAQAKADAAMDKANRPRWDQIQNKPETFPPSPHTHSYTSLTDVPQAFAPASHTHAYDSLSGIPATFAPSAHSHTWDSITGRPTVFPPSAHTHAWADVTDKPTAFAPSSHRHPASIVQAVGSVSILAGVGAGSQDIVVPIALGSSFADYAVSAIAPGLSVSLLGTLSFAESPVANSRTASQVVIRVTRTGTVALTVTSVVVTAVKVNPNT